MRLEGGGEGGVNPYCQIYDINFFSDSLDKPPNYYLFARLKLWFSKQQLKKTCNTCHVSKTPHSDTREDPERFYW